MTLLTKSDRAMATIVAQKPSTNMPRGLYKVIANGLFYGFYSVVRTWTGESAVIAEYADYSHQIEGI